MKKQRPYRPNTINLVRLSMLMLTLGLMIPGLSAQDLWKINFIDTLVKHQSEEELNRVDTINPQFNITFGIRAFIVTSEDGMTHLNVQSLDTALIWANLYFKKIGFQFRYLSINTIPEYEYAFVTGKDSTKEMEVKYERPDYINLFLVDSIKFLNNPVSGYASFPGDTLHSLIVMSKAYASDKTLTQLLGNFFGLLDTDETTGGTEHVNEDNCKTAGDYLCDTWADPNLISQVNDKCQYTGSMRDANGDFYVPSVANLMSHAPDDCKCIFTMDQYRRMLFYYQKFRSGLK